MPLPSGYPASGQNLDNLRTRGNPKFVHELFSIQNVSVSQYSWLGQILDRYQTHVQLMSSFWQPQKWALGPSPLSLKKYVYLNRSRLQLTAYAITIQPGPGTFDTFQLPIPVPCRQMMTLVINFTQDHSSC